MLSTSRFTYLITVLVAAFVAGCQSTPTYTTDGAETLDRSSMAFLVCDSENRSSFLKGLDKRLYIVDIDGKNTFDLGSALFANQSHPERAWVEPGRHYVRVLYEYFGSYAHGNLWLDAEAGKVYRIKKRAEGYQVFFWIVEQESGEPVGGVRGSEPEEAPPAPSTPI